MKTGTLKHTALLLLCLSTVLLILDSIHIHMVDTTEHGLLDFLPDPFIAILLFAYPVFLLGALGLLIAGRKTAAKLNPYFIILLLLHMLIIWFVLAE